MFDFLKDRYHNWAVAVFIAILKVILALAYARAHHPNYFVNLFYYLDILGNALSGGHPYVTISARVGRYSRQYGNPTNLDNDVPFLTRLKVWLITWKWPTKVELKKALWLLCQDRIDRAFYPVDGKGHCSQATLWAETVLVDPRGNPIHIQQGTIGYMVILLPIVVILCFLLQPLIWLATKLRIMSKNIPFDAEEYKRLKALNKM